MNYQPTTNCRESAIDASTRRATGAIQILRLPQVCARTGLCRTMIYQLEAEERFPHRIKISVRAVGWLEEEVQEWLTQRVEANHRTFGVPRETCTISVPG